MGKKVLIIGSGGREYTLAWKLNKEGHQVYVAPGNGGIQYRGIGESIPIKENDFEGLSNYAEKNGIDLTIVGPEAPLAAGLVDYFQEKGLRIFGPTRRLARLEGDKIYSSEIMQAYGVPTPFGRGFTNRRAALDFLERNYGSKTPYIAKARGLHAGKGVIVTGDRDSTMRAVETIMSPSGFDDDVLLQRFVTGREASVMALVGNGRVPLATSKDYKPVGENRFGIDPKLNTGGMGVLSPNPWLSDELLAEIGESAVKRTIKAVETEADGDRYVGVAYGGLMLYENPVTYGVLEWNVRFGDPEIQPVLMRMKSPLLPYLEAAVDGRLNEMPPIEWDPRVAVGAVIATPGYPTDSYKSRLGMELRGADLGDTEDEATFFAGVGLRDGKLVNTGGRVGLRVVLADNWREGREKLYSFLDKGNRIGLGRGEEDTQFREDIGLDALEKVG